MRLVVIGGNAAGMSAAARARRLAPDAGIIVCEKGPQVSYGACGLPYFAEGRVREWPELVAYTADEFRTQRQIDVRENAEVAEVQHARRRVRLAGGEELGYDKLILATGSSPVPIAGLEGPRSFTLYNLSEAIRLRAHLDSSAPGRALVVGAGYLGLEAADVLRSRGWRVELAHSGDHFLRRADPWLTAALEKHLARCGVHVRHRAPVTAAPSQFDIVLVAAGIRPNVELARQAGVRTGITGAIEVSDRMETSVAGIYAAGDCAQTLHLVTGRPVWSPLGTTSNKMGRVAGAAAAGARERFSGIVGTAIVAVCGLGVAVTGLSAEQARREGFQPVEAHIEAPERPRYFRGRPTAVQLVADRATGRLLGGVVLGEHGVAGRINTIATALTRRMTVEEFAQLDLAYAPPFSTVWDPVLIAAQQLWKEL
jgi:NADPH-dependent 2,4-dienoyl-CoA reductase/sulfur reductase-like enzyme